MSEILSLGIGILVIPAIMIILIPLINMVFTDEVVNFINNIIGNIDYFLGSKNTNILLIIIGTIILIKIFKRMLKIIHGNS